jgi:acetyltransferase-like isoleucine patch superfamily enzyme
MIRPSGYYGREMGEGFTIGDHSNIGPYCYVGCAGYIQIGKNVLMGPRVSLFAENHIFSDPERLIREQGVNRQGIIIEDDCWLGSGCIILDGVTIGHGSVVAAGSVVTESIPPLSVVAGVPAKVIKTRAPGAQEKKNNKP